MKRLFTACALLVALVTFSIAPAATLASSPAQQTNTRTLNVTGTIANAGGAFAGTFEIVRFANQNGKLVAIGNLNGTLTDALGNVIGTVTNLLTTLLVTPGNATCEILNLQLGPLDLNLLGLMVHLDQINLDITAQAGPGNLLGNLLCAIAGLLDGGGPLSGLVGLLNNILRNL